MANSSPSPSPIRRGRRRLAVILTGSLLALVALGAVSANALEPETSPQDGPDGTINLWVNAFAEDWSIVNAGLDVNGTLAYTHGGVVLQVGPSVSLTVQDKPVRIGCANGYPILRRFSSWQAQQVYGPGTASGNGAKISFDGSRDVSSNVDHYLWLYYVDDEEHSANPNPCA